MSTDAMLFGRGIAFPPRLDTDGRVGWAAGQRSIRESIRIILTTEPGERLMLPSFGAGLRSYLFEPNVPATLRLIEERVQHALRRWEPRIAVSSVVARAHPDDPSRATVSIGYTLVATRARDSIELSVAVAGGGAA
jgi:phage baseplate assembly protein W